LPWKRRSSQRWRWLTDSDPHVCRKSVTELLAPRQDRQVCAVCALCSFCAW
jgi:hypothetical protein